MRQGPPIITSAENCSHNEPRVEFSIWTRAEEGWGEGRGGGRGDLKLRDLNSAATNAERRETNLVALTLRYVTVARESRNRKRERQIGA